jgi:hypothetical protein
MASLRLIAPLAWTCAIAWFSSDAWSRQRTHELLAPLLQTLLPGIAPEAARGAPLVRQEGGPRRRVRHPGRPLALGPRPLAPPLLLSMLTAILDEAHQSTTAAARAAPSTSPSTRWGRQPRSR